MADVYVLSTGQYVPTDVLVEATIKELSADVAHSAPVTWFILALEGLTAGRKGVPERVSMKRVGVFPYLKPDNATSLPFMGGYVAGPVLIT